MNNNSYNRYDAFTVNGSTTYIPFIKVEPKGSDKLYTYNIDRDRLDKISFMYYNDPTYGWLIMLANPQFGGEEFLIPNNEIIRIPFPLLDSLTQYKQEVERWFLLNGNAESFGEDLLIR